MSLGKRRGRPDVFLRFSRFRFKEGKEVEGLDILRRHAAAVRTAPGCRQAWVAQGQHPATECIVVALFEDEDSVRRLEGKLRADPLSGGAFVPLIPQPREPAAGNEDRIQSWCNGSTTHAR